MIKRITFMKSILMFAVVLLTAFTLVACGDNNQTLVDDALDAVSLVYASGDSATSVTQNLTLPTTVGDVQISWASNNTTVVSNTGVVTRQTADTNVILTATLTLGDASGTKDFTVKVLAAVVVIDPVDAIADIEITGSTLTYSATLSRYTTTTNIVLPTTSMTLAVTWSSSNTAVISTAGVVVRPAYAQPNSTVILTATVGTETREFVVTVNAITEKPVALILQEAQDALLLPGVSDGVSADLTLPATVGTEGVTVTWTSDNAALITDAGVVTRPLDGNQNVILTATLHLGDATVTKEFPVVVLTFAPFTEVVDIAAALALVVDPLIHYYVEIPDVTVVGLFSTGYMIYDGTTLMQVYKAPTNLAVGDVYTIRGEISNYYGSMELVGSANMPIVLFDSEATAAVLTPTVITGSVTDYIATLPAYPLAVGASISYQYVQLTAKVQVDDPLGNYETFLVDTTFTGTGIDSGGTGAFITNALMVYYPSNIGAVRTYSGLDVTINVFLFAQRSNNKIYTVLFTDSVEDIQTTLDDAGIVGVVKTALTASFAAEYTAESTIALPASLLGTSIVWDTASEFVNLETGLVTMPATAGQQVVTLTGALTRGLATDTVTITFKVGQLSVITIADVIALSNTSKLRTTGILTSSEYYHTFFIQDATGGAAIYLDSYAMNATTLSALLAILNANLGKEIEVFGARATYNGFVEIVPTVINVVGDGTMPTPVNVDAFALNATAMLPYQGQLVEMTGLYVSAVVTDSYGNITVTLERLAQGTKINMKWDSRTVLSTEAAALLATVVVGNYINVVDPLAWSSNNPYLYFTATTLITAAVATEADLVALDAKGLVIPAAFTEAGTVVLPVSGITVVTLTATLTLNTTEKVVTFDVSVGNETSSVLTDTAIYTGSTTTNMVLAVNNAEAVNLDPLIFTATPLQGSASAVVGLNSSGQIRIYGNRADGNGNTLTIAVAAGYKITGITFNFGPSSNLPSATLTLGSTEVSLVAADLTSTTKVYDSLSIQSFSLKNTQLNPTGSSNAQIYILSAVITYAVNEFTVTAAYTGSTTNMVVDVNNAALINLDPIIFSVTATYGTGTSLVGLNAAGQIRLYGTRADGNGNTLIISVASGYTITGITFTFGASTYTPTGVLTLGSTPSDLVAADLTNTTKAYDTLSIQSFSLKNNTLGGTSNAQIYIISIEITYMAD